MAARQLNRLTARKVAALADPGRHADGGGLYLSISKDGRRRWVFLFRWRGKLREMGLGTPRDVPLARAREAATRARELVADGRDPLEVKQTDVRAVPTFGEQADGFVEAMRVQWRNDKHVAQWQMTLREYAAPLRSVAVDAVTTNDVVGVLKPLWQTKPETASRPRGCAAGSSGCSTRRRRRVCARGRTRHVGVGTSTCCCPSGIG